ncbi:ABC transporter F family member 4 [Oryzias melastigma]|nr:ABC transporter F family member 4 [Oryzias melastigma]
MTIGKNSRKSSVRSSIRAPKFLDKSSGFYGRLDEPETPTEEVPRNEEQSLGDDSCMDEGRRGRRRSSRNISTADEEVEAFDFSDDGETLLRRKPSRLSSRWRRSTRKKEKEADQEEKPVEASVQEDVRMKIEMEIEEMRRTEEEIGQQKEPALVHFTIRGDADDQVLIRDKKRVREDEEEDEEERKMKREQEEGMKVLKSKTVKNYRKAFDRALRRGWESFINNLYSVTLTPASSSPSSSSPSLKKKNTHTSVLAEFQ